MLLCACMGSYVCGVENVSAYIFHDEYFFSFKRVLVQGRRPCFRRLYRRLCFVKCKRLHCFTFCTPLDKLDKRWNRLDKNFDTDWTKRTEIGQMDKTRTTVDKIA